MKWHDVIGSKWRRWGARHPYLQGRLGLAGTSRHVRWGIFGNAGLVQQDVQPHFERGAGKANQQLSSSLGEVTNRLHQEVGKTALATDVLVNAVHTGGRPCFYC